MKPKPDALPTIRDIARRLGMSIATVSRALNNSPLVTEQTRAMVKEAAAQLGYRQHAMINALMHHVRQRRANLNPSSEVIAFLTSNHLPDRWLDMHSLRQQFNGAKDRARDFGFDLQHFWIGHDGIESRQIARILRARGIRGSLLSPGDFSAKASLDLDWKHHATIAMGYSFTHLSPSRVVHDNHNHIVTCYKALRQAGCRRIGAFFNKDTNTRVRNQWLAGMLGCQYLDDAHRIPPLLFSDNNNPEPFHAWFRKHKPDALITGWDEFAFPWVKALNVRIPQDVSYALLDVGDRMDQCAGILQDNYRLGRIAVELLTAQIFRNEPGIPEHPLIALVEGKWLDGPTVINRKAPARKRSSPAGRSKEDKKGKAKNSGKGKD